MPQASLQVEGLKELVKGLRAADAALPRELTKAHRSMSRMIVDEAERRSPSKRAAAALRAFATPTSASVRGPTNRSQVKWFGVSEFGGDIPRRGFQGQKKARVNPRTGKPAFTHYKDYRGPISRSTPWWDDTAGYWLHPAARAKRRELMNTYEATLDAVLREITDA